MRTMEKKFPVGAVLATPNVLRKLSPKDVFTGLNRHRSGDWGEVCPEDGKANDLALQCGERLLSAYTSDHGVKFWIITEADRSSTTVLLPEDY